MELKTSEYAMEKLNKAYDKFNKLSQKFEGLRMRDFKKYNGIYEGFCIAKMIIIELQDEVEKELLEVGVE